MEYIKNIIVLMIIFIQLNILEHSNFNLPCKKLYSKTKQNFHDERDKDSTRVKLGTKFFRVVN